MVFSADDLEQRRAALLADMAATAEAAGRASSGVALMAVSKTQDEARIDAALRSGQRLFGENKVQEALDHWGRRRDLVPDLRLHLIGRLQRNKVADAIALFDCIETVDRPELVDALAARMRTAPRFPACFVQVNIGEEAQKGGVMPDALPGLLAHARAASLPISGLMAIPPHGGPAAPYFALAAKLARRHGLREISMGMSGDYREAIRLGATIVRVGTALFGERPASSVNGEG